MRTNTFAGILLLFCIPFLPTNPGIKLLDLKKVKFELSSGSKVLFFCRKIEPSQSSSSIEAEFQESILLSTTNDTLGIKTRFTKDNDNLELRLGMNAYLLYKEKVKAIAIKDKVYLACNYTQQDQIFMRYFELLKEGQFLLLKSLDDTFYIKKNDLAAEKLPRTKKGVSNLLKNYNFDPSGFIKSERLNVQKEEDLKKLFDYINKKADLVQH